jgi:hypothetical protein
VEHLEQAINELIRKHPEYVEQLRNIFGPSLSGKRVRILEDFENTGATQIAASRFFRAAFPESHISVQTFFRGTGGTGGDAQDFEPWYRDKRLTGVMEAADDVLLSSPINKKTIALVEETRQRSYQKALDDLRSSLELGSFYDDMEECRERIRERKWQHWELFLRRRQRWEQVDAAFEIVLKQFLGKKKKLSDADLAQFRNAYRVWKKMLVEIDPSYRSANALGLFHILLEDELQRLDLLEKPADVVSVLKRSQALRAEMRALAQEKGELELRKRYPYRDYGEEDETEKAA